NFSISIDGLRVPAFIGLDSAPVQKQVSLGKPVSRPLQIRGQFDTGSIVTGVVPGILAQLGAIPAGSTRTQTAGGVATVQHYLISFTIFDQSGHATLSRTIWPVTDLPVDLPDVDVLFGMDLVGQLKLTVDGPGGSFTLDF